MCSASRSASIPSAPGRRPARQKVPRHAWAAAAVCGVVTGGPVMPQHNRLRNGPFIGRIPAIDEIIDNFSLLDEWDDRYRYVIELGRGMSPLPEFHRTDANKVQGCASQVWLATTARFDGDQPVLELLWRQRRSHRPRAGCHPARGRLRQAGPRDSGGRPDRAVRPAGLARTPHAAAFERLSLHGRTHPRRCAAGAFSCVQPLGFRRSVRSA